ncbi:MAG: adenylate kinase [Verrucomicrobiales bacterium]|jgi:adenylate kinase|nr:adenylate kinase [Verrucomicrobiales bacterium]
MRNFVFIGSPGSGKGTHADLMSERLGILHISTGDLYRDEMALGTPLGLAAKKLLDQGLLGTDEMTEQLLRRRLEKPDANHGFILDGFPRTLPQTEILSRILQERGQKLTAAIFLKVPDVSVIERLSGRLICTHCQKTYHLKYNPPKQAGICDECGGKLHRRADDNPETIKQRLKVFHAQTGPILDYYRGERLLVEVDADAELPVVSRNLEQAVRAFLGL